MDAGDKSRAGSPPRRRERRPAAALLLAAALVAGGCGRRPARPTGPAASAAQPTRKASSPRPTPTPQVLELAEGFAPGLRYETAADGLLTLDLTWRLSFFKRPAEPATENKRLSWRRLFVEEVREAPEGRIRRLVRETREDSYAAPNEKGRRETTDRPTKNTRVTLEVQPDGALRCGDDAPPEAAEELARERLAAILPPGPLRPGQELPLAEARLKALLPQLRQGQGTLRVEGFERAEGAPGWVAKLRGDLQLELDWPVADKVVRLRFTGTLAVHYLLPPGLEILRRLEGDLALDEPVQAKNCTGRVTGTGRFSEVLTRRVMGAGAGGD